MSEFLNIPEIYGSYVFGDKEMRERLPKAIYKSLKRSMATAKSWISLLLTRQQPR